MKRYIRSLITGVIFLFYVISPVKAMEEEGIQLNDDIKSAVLIERDTGKILYDRNIHTKLPPASMTKIMTLLLIMEELDQGNLQLDESILVSERAASMGGSQIFLAAGEEMSVEDLLKGIAIASGNDASVALAERIAGSEEGFVKMMNEKVKELQLENTHFVNSSGLPADNHYSTSYDMAMISKELLKYDEITTYTSIYEDYLREGDDNEFWLVNTNKLVKFYPGVDGLKTGFTNEAKYCLTATAKKGDMRVITVVMGAETSKQRNAAVSQLLDYAFNHFSTSKLFEKGEKVRRITSLKSKNNKIDLVTSESVSTLHKKGEEKASYTTEVILDKEFTLPLKKGERKGSLVISDGKEKITEIPLVVDQEIDHASLFTLFQRSLKELVKHKQ